MKKYKKQLIIVLLLIIVFMLRFGITFAKYVANSVWDYNLKSNGFYFYSDDLEQNMKETNNSKWDGRAVSFNLKNYQNSSIVTEYDINYEVKCNVLGTAATYATCKLNGSNSNTITGILSANQSCQNNSSDEVDVSNFTKSECEINNYIWNKTAVDEDLYFEIELMDGSKNLTSAEVEVVVNSTSPYEKTIKGKFNLSKSNVVEEDNDEVIYTYEDFGSYGRLTITNRTTNATYVSLGWSDSKFIIDENLENLESYTTTYMGYLNRATLLVQRGASKSLIFFKKNPSEIATLEDFTIGKGVPNYLPSYVAGVYQGDESNLYVGGLAWQNDKLLLNGVDQGIEIYDEDANYLDGITLVIYFQRYEGNGKVQNLIMKRASNADGYFMYIDGTANDVIKIDIGGATYRYTTPIKVQDGVDYHIVYTWDPVAKGKLYLDGVLLSTSPLGDAVNLNGAGFTPIKVGFDKDGVYGGNKYPYWGEIKAMNIYNIALSLEEVWDIYQRDISFN